MKIINPLQVLRRLIHALAHLLQMNHGDMYFWHDDDTGKRMAGFKCRGCETIQGVYQLPNEYQTPRICTECEERERHEQA